MNESVKHIFSAGFELIQTVVLALAIFVVIYFLAAQLHQVQGSSMENNFLDGEYILTEKISYRFRDPKRGEVIIFDAPNSPREYIKRVIGLPGEEIKVSNGSIYINGQKLVENYLSVPTYGGNSLREGKPIVIPANYFFVMGDNRERSSDSREFGPISKSTIIGRAAFVFWPLRKLGVIPVPTYNFVSD